MIQRRRKAAAAEAEGETVTMRTEQDESKKRRKRNFTISLNPIHIYLLLVVVATVAVSLQFARDAPQRRTTTTTDESPTPNVNEETPPAKPIFILHVGPPKTSTTTLQYYLSRYSDALLEDNYLYTGRVYDEDGNYFGYYERPYRNMVSWKCQMGQEEDEKHGIEAEDGLLQVYNAHDDEDYIHWTHDVDTPACWKDFLVELEKARRMGRNVIVSEELLCIRGFNQNPFHFHMLHDTLKGDWHVRVLATYRRFHAWLPSEKNHYDQYRLDEDNEDDEMLSWDGVPVSHMHERIRLSLEDPEEHIIYPYLDWIQEQYGKYFDDVQVLNMHDISDEYPTLASQFLCKFVPNAYTACQASKEDEKATSSKRLNTAKSGFYDILSMAAYKQGLISNSTSLTRVMVRDRIEYEHETVLGKTPNDFALICPSREEIQELLDKSLDYEKKFFPEFHRSERGEKKHREEFWKMYDKKRYCSIDTAETLKDERWLTFFDKLNKGEIKPLVYDDEEEEHDENWVRDAE